MASGAVLCTTVTLCSYCSDVVTLFHEFGHGLLHMLTTETDFLVSGIAGIEQDAVEQPSQFLERWCVPAFSEAVLLWCSGSAGACCTILICVSIKQSNLCLLQASCAQRAPFFCASILD